MIVEEIEAEQIVARLLDDIVEGQYLAKDALVSTILSELLARQTTSNPIVLGGVDAALDQVRSVDIRWDSLLRACLAVRDLVGGVLYVESDKLNPRQRRLYLKERIGEDKGQQIRYRKNLKGIERESDFADLATRLYAFGSGSGPGQVKLSLLLIEQEEAVKSWDSNYGYLTLSGKYSAYRGWTGEGDPLPAEVMVYKDGLENNGSVWKQGKDARTLRCPIAGFDPAATYTVTYRHADYLLSDTVGAWGLISRSFTDSGIGDPQTLLEAARLVLEERRNPRVSYRTSLIDLARLGEEWEFERLRLGSIVKVLDEELGIEFEGRIVVIRKPDPGNPQDIEVEISNRSRTLADTITDLYDRIERSGRYQAAPQEEPAMVYKGTHYHLSSTEEQTVFVIPLSEVAVIQGIFLDFAELTKAATVRIYQKIDGVSFQEIDSFFWDPSKRRGFATRHLTSDVDVRATLQSQEAEGVTRNVPYRYYVK